MATRKLDVAAGGTEGIPRAWWLAGLAFLFALYAMRWHAGIEDPPATATAGPTNIATLDEGGLHGRAFVDHARLMAGESARLHLLLERRVGHLGDARLVALDAGALVKSGPCWTRDSGVPDCAAGQTAPGAFAAAHAARRGAISLWAEIRAPDQPGAHVLVLQLEADQAPATLVIGPVDVTTPPRPLETATRHAYGVVKDFGLPLIGAFLAFFFQWWQRRRDSADHDAQDEREHIRETWKSVFPRAHENVVRHLLPMISDARAFLERSSGAPAGDTFDGREALHRLMVLTRKMHDLSRTGGGIFLADLDGETVVVACWTWLRERLYAQLGHEREALFHVLDRIKADDSVVTFEARFRQPASAYAERSWDPHLAVIRAAVERWVKEPGFGLDRRVLTVFVDTLQYEIDRLYDTWYGAPSAAPVGSVTDLLQALAASGAPAGVPDPVRLQLHGALTAYRALLERAH